MCVAIKNKLNKAGYVIYGGRGYLEENNLFLVSNIIIKSTIMLSPIIPDSASKILSIYNLNIIKIDVDNFHKLIDKNISINSPKPIFPRID